MIQFTFKFEILYLIKMVQVVHLIIRMLILVLIYNLVHPFSLFKLVLYHLD